MCQALGEEPGQGLAGKEIVCLCVEEVSEPGGELAKERVAQDRG